MASTTVKITNCTTETARFVTHHDYYEGHIKEGDYYPKEITKGETVEFVFVSKEGLVPTVSSGAVVYQGHNEKGKKFDWMYAWENTGGREVNIYKAYTVIAKADHVWDWAEVHKKLLKSDTTSEAKYDDCVSHAAISKQQQATYQGTMSLGGESTS